MRYGHEIGFGRNAFRTRCCLQKLQHLQYVCRSAIFVYIIIVVIFIREIITITILRSCYRLVVTACIGVGHGSFNRVFQVAPTCTPFNNTRFLGRTHQTSPRLVQLSYRLHGRDQHTQTTCDRRICSSGPHLAVVLAVQPNDDKNGQNNEHDWHS